MEKNYYGCIMVKWNVSGPGIGKVYNALSAHMIELLRSKVFNFCELIFRNKIFDIDIDVLGVYFSTIKD